jgi:hypothetical protein
MASIYVGLLVFVVVLISIVLGVILLGLYTHRIQITAPMITAMLLPLVSLCGSIIWLINASQMPPVDKTGAHIINKADPFTPTLPIYSPLHVSTKTEKFRTSDQANVDDSQVLHKGLSPSKAVRTFRFRKYPIKKNPRGGRPRGFLFERSRLGSVTSRENALKSFAVSSSASREAVREEDPLKAELLIGWILFPR